MGKDSCPPLAQPDTATSSTSSTSISGEPSQHEQGEQKSRSLPCWYPKWRGKPALDGNGEALAFALDSIGRSVALIGAGAFLSTGLLRLAKEAAGCDVDEVCEKRVHGIRPSSLLTTYTIVVGLVSAAVLPLIGAIVDFSSYRRLVGRTTSVFFCLLNFPTIFLNSETWFAVAILQIMVAFLGWAQAVVTYAYLPELTDSESQLTKYTRSFTIVNFGSMVIYLAAIVGISEAAGIGSDSVATARLGQAVLFGISSVSLYLAWGCLFQQRPAARVLPEGRSLWTAGFVQIYHTSIHIYKNFHALKWFFISVSLIDSATSALATIFVTYSTDLLGFTSRENGIVVLIMLVASIPGAYAGSYVTRKFNPVRSSLTSTVILAVNTLAAAIVLKGKGQQIQTYILALVWGIGTGWKWSTDRVLVSTILPAVGQDAELMGIYLFAGQVLVWLPPLVFTVLNEAGVNPRIGVGTLSVFFMLGFLALCRIGNYRKAVEFAGRMHVDSIDGDERLDVIVEKSEGKRLEDLEKFEKGDSEEPCPPRSRLSTAATASSLMVGSTSSGSLVDLQEDDEKHLES
jgi:MFS-type transporter involved in bile tolerance (Atg22 family)